jgi:hypothetical protein
MSLVLGIERDFPGIEVTDENVPEGKLSAALLELIEPYREQAAKGGRITPMVLLGELAWNLTLLQEEERQREIDEIFAKFFPDADAETVLDLRSILAILMLRKQLLFPDDRRLILNAEALVSGIKLQVGVTSAPILDSPPNPKTP